MAAVLVAWWAFTIAIRDRHNPVVGWLFSIWQNEDDRIFVKPVIVAVRAEQIQNTSDPSTEPAFAASLFLCHAMLDDAHEVVNSYGQSAGPLKG